MTNRLPWQALVMLVFLAVMVVGCAPEQRASEGESSKEKASGKSSAVPKKTVEKKYTPPKKILSAPEPAVSPPLDEKPAGEVIQLRSAPEGVVADSETGLVGVGLRNPDQLALVDGDSGRVIRTVNLSGSPRHLGLVAPGGPVLVPAEPSDSLVQVGLPEGKVIDETPVGNFPHNVAAAPGGRIFVISEGASTASVIENGEVIGTIKTPLSPGGGAVTGSGLLGIVGVKGLALEIYEADTLDSVDIIDAGKGPTHVEAGPGDRFYVADTRGDALLDYETHPELELAARVPLPDGSPYGIALDPRRDQLWVTLTADNRLVLFDLKSGVPRKVADYATVRQPNSVAVDQSSSRVFVAGRTEEVLQVIDP